MAAPDAPAPAGTTVACLGTGRMGAAMIRRLAAAGAQLRLWNRTASRAEALAAEVGAVHAATPAGAVAGAQVVLVCLADDAAALAAYRGPDGLLAGLGPDTVVCDTSTLDPRTVEALAPEVAGRGAVLLDCPVSGSVSVAEAGHLTFMVGGDQAALDRARPVLAVLGGSVVRIGGTGAGATMKLVVNSVLLGLNQAVAEGLVLAEQAGLDRTTAYDVLAAGAVGAPFVRYKRDAFLDPDGTPVAFTLDLVAKDLGLARALAARVGARADQLAVNEAVAAEAVANGFGDRDLSAVAQFLRPNRDQAVDSGPNHGPASPE